LVYENGELLINDNLAEIRKRAKFYYKRKNFTQSCKGRKEKEEVENY
jgi:hypothetical protein